MYLTHKNDNTSGHKPLIIRFEHKILIFFAPFWHFYDIVIWPSLAQHSITQVMIYNLGYDL